MGENKLPSAGKITVLLVKTGKYPKLVEIGSSLKEMQSIVGGCIEVYKPFKDNAVIVCNEEGKINGMPLNRAIHSKPTLKEMDYKELCSAFREAERNGKHITGYIVFSEDSFDKTYPVESRTYEVSSNNKAFQPNMGGYSIYASCLDGSDQMVRLEGYIEAEHGGANGWKIEKCYMKSRKIEEIISGDFFVAYMPIDSEEFLSLPKSLSAKYAMVFRKPEHFFRDGDEIIAVPFNP